MANVRKTKQEVDTFDRLTGQIESLSNSLVKATEARAGLMPSRRAYFFMFMVWVLTAVTVAPVSYYYGVATVKTENANDAAFFYKESNRKVTEAYEAVPTDIMRGGPDYLLQRHR